MNAKESRSTKPKTTASNTALKLISDLPRTALREYSNYLHGAIDEYMAKYGPFGALCLLGEDITRKDLSFPVVAGDSGTYALPTLALLERGLHRYILLGFCDLSKDESRVTNPIPLPGWGEHSEYIAEMMMHAIVTES